MGHLGGFCILLMWPLTCLCVWGHFLPTCDKQLQFRCGDGTCIPEQNVCDGRTDCQDASDEQSCGHLGCKEDEFTCSNTRCLPQRFLCDGEDNCGDGSDEASCQNCTAFSCGPTDVCLSRGKVCDGRADCRDSRDESPELCTLPGPRGQVSGSCALFQFQCGDGRCISRAFRCDNMSDCFDGSDEKNCDQDACKVNKGGCSHGCVNLPMGSICVCPENMRLLTDHLCEEVDPCLERDVCDQLCVDLNGTQTCRCHKDYWMDRVSRECRVKGDSAQLVVTSSTGLRWKNIRGDDFTEEVPRSAGRGPVTALASNRTVYWAPQGQAAVYRVSMAGNPEEPLLLPMKLEGTVTGLALDWIHKLLYWTSAESAALHVGLLDGSVQRPLITGLDRPSAVAVDPLHRLLFWAQCGSSAKIVRASLDGRDRKPLVTHLIRNPVALSLDVPRKLLYWLDQGTKTISRVNLEGHHRKTVVESNGYLDRPFGLAVFEGFVYWSDEVTQSVCRADKHNGRKLQVLLLNSSSPGDVVVVHPALQPNEPTVCGNTEKVCPNKCVIDLTSQTPGFHCAPPEREGEAQTIPAISRTVPPSTLSDPLFAGILSLVVCLSVLIAGTAVWWWRDVFRPPRPITEQSFSLKESQDPLITQGPHMDSSLCPHKETLLKLNRDSE